MDRVSRFPLFNWKAGFVWDFGRILDRVTLAWLYHRVSGIQDYFAAAGTIYTERDAYITLTDDPDANGNKYNFIWPRLKILCNFDY